MDVLQEPKTEGVRMPTEPVEQLHALNELPRQMADNAVELVSCLVLIGYK
jgi:hypothetical protein